MEPPIPLKGVVLFIAFGTMIFIIVFCFVKRQITRFTLRSSSGLHALIGSDAPKPLAAEIERRLKWVKDVACEPLLLQPDMEEKFLQQSNFDPGHFVFRMKAVDSVKLLDAELKKFDPCIFRKPGTSMKAFLLEQRQVGPLEGTKLDLVEKFSTAYDHARHDPKEFVFEDFQQFMDLLMQLVVHVRNRCNNSNAGSAEQDKLGKERQSLTYSLQYRTSGEHDSMGLGSDNQNDDTLTPEIHPSYETKSQRMANYALAGGLSLKTDLAKSKDI